LDRSLRALVISSPAMICQVRRAGEMLAEDSEVCGSFWPWVHGVGYANVRKHVGPVTRPVCQVSWARVQDFSILLRPGSPLLRFLCACILGVESVDGVPFRLSIAEELRPKYPQHH
jgi:hypothetical protein